MAVPTSQGGGENHEGPTCSYHSQPLTTATGPRVHTLPGWETKQAAGSVGQARRPQTWLHIGVTCISSWETLI